MARVRPETSPRDIALGSLSDHRERGTLRPRRERILTYWARSVSSVRITMAAGWRAAGCVFRHTLCLSVHMYTSHRPRTGFPDTILIMIYNHTHDLSSKSLIIIMIFQRFD